MNYFLGIVAKLLAILYQSIYFCNLLKSNLNVFISFRNKSKEHWLLKVVIRWLDTILRKSDFISVLYLAIFLEFEMLVFFFCRNSEIQNYVEEN